MTKIEQANLRALTVLAHARFSPELLDGEVRVLQLSSRRTVTPIEELPLNEQPEVVRSGLIKWLITDPDAGALLDPDGIVVYASQVTPLLDLDGCSCLLPVNFTDCTFEFGFSINFASVRNLGFQKCRVSCCFLLRGSRHHGHLSLLDCELTCSIELLTSKIEGTLVTSNTQLLSAGPSLIAAAATIEGNVILAPGFHAKGHVSFDSARIDGNLTAMDARFEAADICFSATGADISGNVDMSGATFNSACFLRNTRFGGLLSLRNCEVSDEESKMILQLSHASIEGDLNLSLLKTRGELHLVTTAVRGNLNLIGAKIGLFHGAQLSVEQDFMWRGVMLCADGWLILDQARIATLRDDESSWPSPGNLRLQGAKIGRLIQHRNMTSEEKLEGGWTVELPFTATERIAWLNRQDNVATLDAFAWFQVADMFRAHGNTRAARDLTHQLRKHEAEAQFRSQFPIFPSGFVRPDRRKRELTRQWCRFQLAIMTRRFRWLSNRALGLYEWEPLLILASVTLSALLGTCVFWPFRAHFSPTVDDAYKAAYSSHAKGFKPSPYPEFSPFVYSLENVLPVIKLGQDDKWAPNAQLKPKWVYWLLVNVRLVLILAGWMQATILATVLTQRFASTRR